MAQALHARAPSPGSLVLGKTPMQNFIDSVPLAKEKILAA